MPMCCHREVVPEGLRNTKVRSGVSSPRQHLSDYVGGHRPDTVSRIKARVFAEIDGYNLQENITMCS